MLEREVFQRRLSRSVVADDVVGIFVAIGLAVNHEAVEVEALPPHSELDSVVQIGEAHVAPHQQAPVDHGADAAQEDLDLVDLRELVFKDCCCRIIHAG